MSRISVCVATRDRKNVVHQLLWSLRNQTFKQFDVVIVDDSETDFSVESWTKDAMYSKILSELSMQGHRLKIISGPKTTNVGAAYQTGWLFSRKEWANPLFFRGEDDSWLSPDYFELLVPLFDDPSVGGASGLVLTPGAKHEVLEQDSDKYKHGTIEHLSDGFNLQWVRHSSKDPFNVEHLHSTHMMSDSALERVNGYDTNLYSFFREDTQISWRVFLEGYKLLVHPLAEAYHFKAGNGGARAVKDKSKGLDDLRRWSLQKKSMKPGIFIHLSHAIGDLIMATPALRQLRAYHSDRNIVVYHPHGKQVLVGNPNVDVIADGPMSDQRTFRLEKSIYGWMSENKWDGHMANAYCKMLGVREARDVTPELYGVEPSSRGHSYIVVAPQSNARLFDYSDYSKTKYWEHSRWQELINYLSKDFEVVHLTGKEVIEGFDNVTLVNNLEFRESWSLIAGAEFVVSIDTMAQHVAAALDVPAVVLWGRTKPSTYGYIRNRSINIVRDCPENSPCFRGVRWQQDKTQCPLDGHPCMNMSVDDVKAAIEMVLRMRVAA